MNKKELLIKICGVTDANIAKQAISASANMIGLVFHPPSIRHINICQAIKIADVVHAVGGIVVPVFVNQSKKEIVEISQILHTKIIQLHGASIKQVFNLDTAYTKIIARQPQTVNQYKVTHHDFLLLDNAIPGSGKLLALDNFHKPNQRFFIAGGLKQNNVQTIIQQFQPDGIDVSTHVETQPGIKSITLIQQFIERARTC